MENDKDEIARIFSETTGSKVEFNESEHIEIDVESGENS